jgi:hypothetical protein
MVKMGENALLVWGGYRADHSYRDPANVYCYFPGGDHNDRWYVR